MFYSFIHVNMTIMCLFILFRRTWSISLPIISFALKIYLFLFASLLHLVVTFMILNSSGWTVYLMSSNYLLTCPIVSLKTNLTPLVNFQTCLFLLMSLVIFLLERSNSQLVHYKPVYYCNPDQIYYQTPLEIS